MKCELSTLLYSFFTCCFNDFNSCNHISYLKANYTAKTQTTFQTNSQSCENILHHPIGAKGPFEKCPNKNQYPVNCNNCKCSNEKLYIFTGVPELQLYPKQNTTVISGPLHMQICNADAVMRKYWACHDLTTIGMSSSSLSGSPTDCPKAQIVGLQLLLPVP